MHGGALGVFGRDSDGEGRRGARQPTHSPRERTGAVLRLSLISSAYRFLGLLGSVAPCDPPDSINFLFPRESNEIELSVMQTEIVDLP